jgi:phage baseplate assembly protein W
MNVGRVFGRSVAFPPRVGPDGRVAFSEGEENVRESIRLILMTEPGERVMRPEFGGGLGRFLFEPNTPATHQAIRAQIHKSLARWEPRVVVESVQIDVDPGEPGAALVTLTYRLVATQARERVSLNVTLSG